jgi:O-succinylbenzoic acid--CoA ligase
MERVELINSLRATGCAEFQNGCVFLCDPKWSAEERVNLDLLQRSAYQPPGTEMGDGWVCIPTGGTSGTLRFARHDEHTLGAAVAGFCTHFGLGRVNAVGVLPAHHVSGLMARLRCAATGGEHVPWDWKDLEAGRWPGRIGEDWMISLVPTQLQRLLASPSAVNALRRFGLIFLGGGPVWPALADAAAAQGLRISLSYGMTETAAMVTALKPEEFLAGRRTSGRPLPHARVSIGPDGTVRIAGESVFRGYFPEMREERVLITEDLGEFDADGHLRVLGRRDAVIITGGEKVQPLEVEAALRASGEFSDVAVVGIPDAEWGERVVACYPAEGRTPDLGVVSAALAGLAGFKRPKRFLPVADWPRNAQGKLNRGDLIRRAIRDAQA